VVDLFLPEFYHYQNWLLLSQVVLCLHTHFSTFIEDNYPEKSCALCRHLFIAALLFRNWIPSINADCFLYPPARSLNVLCDYVS
jgi:hypothetical protein